MPRIDGWHWVVLYSLIAGAWAGLFALEVSLSDIRGITTYGLDYLIAICRVDPASSGAITVFLMWGLMTAGMMLPSLLPGLTTYDDLRSSGAATRRGFLGLILGYLLAWGAFAAVAAGLQILASARLGFGEDGSIWQSWQFACAMLAAAGAYQFSPVKDACLSRCRHPLAFFVANWKESRFNELNLGFRLGAVCIACCWLLMSLAFIGGAMTLAWMGVATVFMLLEKLSEIGRIVSRPLGVLLIGTSALIAVSRLAA